MNEKDIERELFETLTKVMSALDRMMMSLQPLIEAYRQPVQYLPPPPQGDPLCKLCEGAGIQMFIGDNDLWKSRKCDCNGS